MTWLANCAKCGQPLSEQRGPHPVRYHLTHSPNGAALVGIAENNLSWSVHRAHVIQHTTWIWELLCQACYSVACSLSQRPNGGAVPAKRQSNKGSVANLEAYRVAVDPAVPGAERQVFKIASTSQPNKFYYVTINPSTNHIECTCPWAMYHSNQDQGVKVKWCQHVLIAVKQLSNE